MWLGVALCRVYLRLPWLDVAWRGLVSLHVGPPLGSQVSLALLTLEIPAPDRGVHGRSQGGLPALAALCASVLLTPCTADLGVSWPALGQTGKSRILTPRASAMRARSPGSLVTTGAWFWTAVTMTMASTASAVPDAAQATPAARPAR